jgi:hypothetical protein
MAHVLMMEGTTYTDFYDWEDFTEQEKKMLARLGDQVCAARRTK